MSDAGSEYGESRDDEFKKAVKEYVATFDDIAEMRAIINQKNKKKKRLNDFIIAYMRDSNKDICNLGAMGTIQMKEHTTSVTLKKEYVAELLNQILQDETKAKESAEFIFQQKQKKVSYRLHRKNVAD
jgi:cob(I)alamin adenosyltransferase